MLWRTHLTSTAVIGLPILAWNHDILTYSAIEHIGIHSAIGIGTSIIAVGGLLFGSLLPDIDEPNSKIGQRFTRISEFLKSTFGHRGAVHSFFALFLLLFITDVVKTIPPIHLLFGCICFGFGLHLFEDYFSYMGIKWFAPVFNKDFKFPIYAMRYEVGGIKENIILVISFILLIEEVGVMFFNLNLFKILI